MKAGLGQHAFQRARRKGGPGLRRRRHGIGEHRLARRRDAILIGHEFRDRDPPARRQGGPSLAEQADTGRLVDDAELGISTTSSGPPKSASKRAADQGLEAVAQLRGRGVLPRHIKDIVPVQRRHLGLGELAGEGDAEQPMAGGDIQYPAGGTRPQRNAPRWPGSPAS